MSPVPYLLGVRSFSELAWNRCTSCRLRFFRPRRKGFLIWLPHTPFLYQSDRNPQKSSPEREIFRRSPGLGYLISAAADGSVEHQTASCPCCIVLLNRRGKNIYQQPAHQPGKSPPRPYIMPDASSEAPGVSIIEGPPCSWEPSRSPPFWAGYTRPLGQITPKRPWQSSARKKVRGGKCGK